MPYKNIKELPESIKKNLPREAQEIFKEAYNNSWEYYKDPEKRRGDSSREEVANKVAWSAVKEEFEKRQGVWKKKK